MSVSLTPVSLHGGIWVESTAFAAMELVGFDGRRFLEQILTNQEVYDFITLELHDFDDYCVAICDTKKMFEIFEVQDRSLVSMTDRLRFWKDSGVNEVVVKFDREFYS